MLAQGLDAVFARHQRWAAGVRAVRAWGLPIQCADASVYSPVLTGVITPAGVDADRCAQADPPALRPLAGHRPRQGEGPHVPHRPPGRLQRPHADGRAGRLEMGFKLAGVAIAGSGVQAAMEHFAAAPQAIA